MKRILFFFLIFLCSYLVFPEEILSTHSENILLSPSAHHWLGTDSLGRDFSLRLFMGLRMSLLIGIFSSFGSLLIGVFLGSYMGWKDSWTDRFILRFIDVFQSLPQFILLSIFYILFLHIFSDLNLKLKLIMCMILGISLTHWMNVARLTRGFVRQIKSQAFIESTLTLGATPLQIWRDHILLHLKPQLLIWMGLQIPSALIYESFMSFLGFGLQPPLISLGVLIQEGWRSLSNYPHLLLFPGLALFAVVFGINLWLEKANH